MPNAVLSPTAFKGLVLVEVALALLVWLNSPFKTLPRPQEVLNALRVLWFEQGMGQELIASFTLNLQALGITTLLSLGFAYLTVLPVFRPIVSAISKGRFLSLVGFTFVFTLMLGGGHNFKLALMIFGMSVFFVTTMAATVEEIPREAFDHARTLRMSEWRVVWEVVVLGTFSQAFEAMRQNAAIGWLMLTMVEGLARGEGGVGVLLLNQNKYLNLSAVFAIQLAILVVGLLQDYAIGVLRHLVCPYARLTLERR
jgi:NitT/TauT family transport system permease protein